MTWHELDERAKRKALILGAIVGGGLLVLMWPSGVFRARPTPRPSPFQAQRANAAPPARRPAPAPPQQSPDAGILGKWAGEGAELANRRVCRLWLEIGKKADETGKYTGAATLSCIPALSLGAPKLDTPQTMLLAPLNPLAATMSGAWEKDAIAFRLDKQLNAGDCAWTSVSVSRFGTQNLSAEIQDACGGGSVLLHRFQ